MQLATSSAERDRTGPSKTNAQNRTEHSSAPQYMIGHSAQHMGNRTVHRQSYSTAPEQGGCRGAEGAEGAEGQ